MYRDKIFRAIYTALYAVALVLVARDAGIVTMIKAAVGACAFGGALLIGRPKIQTTRVRGEMQVPEDASTLGTNMATAILKAGVLDTLHDKGVVSMELKQVADRMSLDVSIDYYGNDLPEEDDADE